MICEYCNEEYTNNYSSGRFCSAKCSRGFSTKEKRSEINRKVSKKLTGRKVVLTPEQSEKRIQKQKNTWNEKKMRRLSELHLYNFDELPQDLKKQKILLDQEGKCSDCGITETWNGKPLKFELDHISGIRTDNSRENLRCLCPNCHSQTPTYKTLNHVYREKKIADEDFCNALKNNDSIYKALVALELNPHGGNYMRARRIIKFYNLDLPYLLI